MHTAYDRIQTPDARKPSRRTNRGANSRWTWGRSLGFAFPLDGPAGRPATGAPSLPEIRLGRGAPRTRLRGMNDMKPLKHRPRDAALLERLKAVVGPKGAV